MDFLQVLMIILILVGLTLIVVSVYFIKKESEENKALNFKVDEAFTMINNSIEEYEQTTNEFNNVAEIMFKEIDEKYQELLMLYSLIEEKKYENNTESVISKDTVNNKNKARGKNNTFLHNNKNSNKIIELYESGMPVDKIAKKLKIGIGEVQLIINLRKA